MLVSRGAAVVIFAYLLIAAGLSVVLCWFRIGEGRVFVGVVSLGWSVFYGVGASLWLAHFVWRWGR
jgi:hypothetical protein